MNRLRKELIGASVCSVSDTEVAAMGKLRNKAFAIQRSATRLVATVTQQCVGGLGASASIVQIVESLVWVFVARTSLRKSWFSDKELRRFTASMRCTARRVNAVASEDNHEQTYVKYWLDSYLCKLFGEKELPAKDSFIVDPLFSGWCKRFLARRLAKKDLSFFYSLQKGSKKAWSALGKLKEKAALDKHYERLTTDHGLLPEDLHDEVVQTSRRIFRSCRGPVAGTKFLPSGSACLQATRREGGALGLFEQYHMPLESREAKIVGKLPVLNASLGAWRQSQYDIAMDSALRNLHDIDDAGISAGTSVSVQAIPEPGKFRIITKGDGYLYSALQPLQGQMLSDWKHCSAATMRDQDLTEKVRSLDAAVPDMPLWCSVDYEAATDLLKRDATTSALEPLMGHPLWGLACASLMRGWIEYPDGRVGVARDGQLMGSPLSFAILCCVNLAVYHTALKRWYRAQKSRYRRMVMTKLWNQVLVNGDDMLFKGNEELIRIFRQTALDAGLKFSQGKNYSSPDCCMINSQVFRRTGGVMRRYGYLNMKLILGVSLKSGESHATPTQIGKDLSEMVKLCPWTSCAIPKALSRWGKDWFGPIYRPNWYLPVHLGGFGLDLKQAPDSWRVTRSQREMAARFVSDPRLGLYRRKGMFLPVAKIAGALAHWRLISGPYVEGPGESDNVTDSWLERLAYAVRASSGAYEVADKIVVCRFRPQYKLKPISDDGLKKYWSARWMATFLPPCPPLGCLRVYPYEAL